MSNFYSKSIELLHKCSTEYGFLASAQNISNYKRVWSRDGVICGLAALASKDEELILTFKQTLETLAKHQHRLGTIPSNVHISENITDVSYGGLAGRVDAVTWFVIGVCQFAYQQNDNSFFNKYKTQIEKCFDLLETWEFNNKHLMYVPLSGNWADEYITDGYVLYDQLLRVWALKSYNYFEKNDAISKKIENIIEQIEINFLPSSTGEKFHERAYNEVDFKDYLPCSFSPSGYKIQYDAFANSLALMLNIGSVEFQTKLIKHSFGLASESDLGLLPAFWPVITEKDEHWSLLKDNCKYEFRNYPYEFHNGGSWCMVNGFFGVALVHHKSLEQSDVILENINRANAVGEFSFYENFNTQTKEPNGVPYCAWSAAGAILLHQVRHNNFKILI
ncbi:MAG: fructofuranosidase/invertase [Flavobacteriaceae bacterium]|nr:fructofuranosidase/invertase [Flavobacteriaceae bacterium]|tara:strand:- start:3268 stop:4440 length:1173 start_codon:yes stop_codon:yes gene_type:complete